jgi:hypothetical protein
MMDFLTNLQAWLSFAGLVCFFPACLLLEKIRIMRERKPQPEPQEHTHQIDIEHSRILSSNAGAIYGKCALAGCGEVVYMGQVFSFDQRATK